MNFKVYFFSILQFLVFFLSLVTAWHAALVLTLFAIVIVMMLDKLGKGIVLRETIALHSCFICLVMPLVGYHFFDSNNDLARIWVKYMPISSKQYFDYTLPAIAGFVCALCLPLMSQKKSDNGIFLKQRLEVAKKILEKHPKIGVYLLILGTIIYWTAGFLPSELQFAFFLFYFAAFAGLLYVYYSKSYRFRLPILLLFGASILMNAIDSGMFTIVAYMGLTLVSFFFLGWKTSLFKKVLWFCVGIFGLLVIQIVKPAYRKATWEGEYEGSKGLLLTNLIVEKVSDLDWGSADAFFPVYVRTNQGFNVALVMRRMPNEKKFDFGDRLFLTLVSSFVPRFFWPDKPEAGGKFNMEYYTGNVIKGWSTNVGPLGEAYGSFGVTGGIIFMIFLGGFLRWAYSYVFILSNKIPLILFWIPVLFYQITYSAESDTLQIMNSLVKSTFFIFILYNLIPSIFRPHSRPQSELTKIHKPNRGTSHWYSKPTP